MRHNRTQVTNNICISCFSVFRSKSLEFITCPYRSLATFRRHLKTFYFQSAYLLIFQLPTLPRISASVHPDSSSALRKLYTYLLTYLTAKCSSVNVNVNVNVNVVYTLKQKVLSSSTWWVSFPIHHFSCLSDVFCHFPHGFCWACG